MHPDYKRKNILTLDDFIDLSFNYSELEDLIANSLIERKGEFYTYSSLHNIINYYFQLIRENKRDFANKCLRLSYLIDPVSFITNYELFANSIKSSKYEESVIYLEILLTNSSEEYKNDYLFYLSLISTIIDLKGELKNLSNSIGKRDLMLQQTREDIHNIEIENEIRKLVYAQKYIQAISILRKNHSNYERKRDYHIRYSLIQKAAEKQIDFKEKIQKLLNEKRYSDCYLLLKRKSQQNQLSLIEKYVCLALEDLISIKYTKRLPFRFKTQKYNNAPSNIYDLIYGGNYREALIMCSNLSNIEKNIIYKILIAINEEIEHLIDLSTNEMISGKRAIDEESIEKTFFNLLSNGIPIYTLYKVLKLKGKQQFKCLLYAAKMLYTAGNLTEGDRLLDEASSLNYTNEKLLKPIFNQRTNLLEKCLEQRENHSKKL